VHLGHETFLLVPSKPERVAWQALLCRCEHMFTAVIPSRSEGMLRYVLCSRGMNGRVRSSQALNNQLEDDINPRALCYRCSLLYCIVWVIPMSRQKNPMFWILVATLGLAFLASLPLFFALSEYGKELFTKLWGYSPNQFAFLLFVFPSACISILVGLRHLFSLQSTLPSEYARVLAHPPIVFLIAGACACVIAIGAYFNAELGFDTLKREHAAHAVAAVSSIQRTISSSESEEVENEMLQKEVRRAIFVAKERRGTLLNQPIDEAHRDLERLRLDSPATYLRLVQDNAVRFKLELSSPTMLAVNMIELVVSVGMAILGILSVLLFAVTAAKSGFDGAWGPDLQRAGLALFIGVFLFSLYSIAVGHASAEMQHYIGPFSGLAESYLAAGVCVILMLVLILTGPQNDKALNSISGLARAGVTILPLPATFLATRPNTALQILIGVQTNWGIQLAVGLFSLAVFVGLTLLYGPWLKR
jgi:hypothetical protein